MSIIQTIQTHITPKARKTRPPDQKGVFAEKRTNIDASEDTAA
jgi:hypothetical protein